MSALTISISTHKGGTGKTVTSMALGSALARAGRKTLLVDLDPQGHSTIGLGVEIEDKDLTIRDLFTEPPVPVAKVIRQTHLPDLDILPSNIRLARVAQALYMRPKREEVLRRALQPILKDYAFILVDCPPSLGVLTEMGIAAADRIIVPCQMEARAADGLVDLLEVVSIVKGEGFEGWKILLTRVDGRKTVTNEVVMAALAQWSQRIYSSSIPQSEPLNQAQIARTDIYNFEPNSKGALAYLELAQEILKYGQ
jgi:chromosome partitioning protein